MPKVCPSIVGERFGRLVVLSEDLPRGPRGQLRVLCRCDCGVDHSTVANNLKSGTTKSCGCLRLIRNGERRGSANPRWKGGISKHLNADGYVRLYISRSHDLANSTYRPMLCVATDRSFHVAEHRLALAQHIGRPLGRHETVHHLNGDRADNRIGNLELRVGAHGPGATHAHCHTCRCFDED